MYEGFSLNYPLYNFIVSSFINNAQITTTSQSAVPSKNTICDFFLHRINAVGSKAISNIYINNVLTLYICTQPQVLASSNLHSSLIF